MAEIKFLYICISTAWGDNLMTRLGMVLDEYTIHELESRTTCIIEYNAINDTGYGFYSCTALAEPLMDENGTGGNRRRSIMYSICHRAGYTILVISLEKERYLGAGRRR